MAKKLLLEIAMASLDRAVAAERAGAHRLELCDSLEVGGLTPSIELIRRVRAAVRIPIHVLVRPRAGNFVYDDDEFVQMQSAISALRNENVDGIVAGILHPDRSVDVPRTRELITLAAPLSFTFHRAFDDTHDLSKALEDVALAGATRLLTSAGAPCVTDAAETLRQLVEQAASRLAILPGGGLHAGNMARVAHLPGIHELHTGLGTVLPYGSSDLAAFQHEVQRCVVQLHLV